MPPPLRLSFPVVLLHYIPVKISCRSSPPTPAFRRDGSARILSSNSRSGLCASEAVPVGQRVPASSSELRGKHETISDNGATQTLPLWRPPAFVWSNAELSQVKGRRAVKVVAATQMSVSITVGPSHGTHDHTQHTWM